jgi:hypothetical protein
MSRIMVPVSLNPSKHIAGARRMKPISQWVQRRSLTYAGIAFLLSLIAASQNLQLRFAISQKSVAFGLQAIVLFVLAGLIALHALTNLVRDVERGYSSNRCALAAVILLGAFFLLSYSGIGLFRLISTSGTP